MTCLIWPNFSSIALDDLYYIRTYLGLQLVNKIDANFHFIKSHFRTQLQKTMQNNAAVFRTGEVLEEGCEITQEVYDDMKNMKVCTFFVFINSNEN